MYKKGFSIFGVIYILIWIAAIMGWMMNLIAVFQLAAADKINAMFVLRCIGILVAPLGAILGWF